MNTRLNEKDFEKIYQETYLNTLKFITIRCYHIEDINDILQDTYVEFFKLLKRRKNLEIEKIESFICGIAHNVIKRYYAKKKNLICFVGKEDEIGDIADDFDLEHEVILKEDVQKIENYLKTKDLLTAKTFYLYFVFGMKISEVAEELRLNESNVKNKIYRTLKELQGFLRKEEVENDK